MRKPRLLILAQFVAAFLAAGFLLTLALAPLNLGMYTIYGEPVTGPQFFREAGPAFLLAIALHGAIAFALWQRRPWARPLMFAYWPAFGVMLAVLYLRHPEAVPDVVGTAVVCGVWTAVTWWYLYRRKNVAAYFDALPRRARSDSVLHN